MEPAEPNLRADAPVGSAGFLDPPFHRSVGLKAFGRGPASEIYSLCFLKIEKRSWNRNFVGNRRLFWGASEFPKAPAKGFSRRTAANFNLLLRVKVPLCKDFSA